MKVMKLTDQQKIQRTEHQWFTEYICICGVRTAYMSVYNLLDEWILFLKRHGVFCINFWHPTTVCPWINLLWFYSKSYKEVLETLGSFGRAIGAVHYSNDFPKDCLDELWRGPIAKCSMVGVVQLEWSNHLISPVPLQLFQFDCFPKPTLRLVM